MSKSKKIFSILIAVVMIANLFAFTASALRDTDDKVAIIVTADKTKLVAGDTITFSLAFQLPAGLDPSTFKFGLFQLGFFYDSSVLTYVANSRQWATDYVFFKSAAVQNPTAAFWNNGAIANDARFDNGALIIAAGGYDDTNYTALSGYNIVSGATVCTFQFKVSDSLPVGTTTYFGITDETMALASRSYIKAVTGSAITGGKAIPVADYDINRALVTLTDKNFAVAGTDAKVRPGTQAAPTSYIAGGVLSNLDLRLEAKFDKTAFDATYAPATAGAPCQNITECGFIVAKTTDLANGAADLTVANANGTTIRKASVGKIQDKTTYYNMVLAISGIPAAELATEYTYVAYITNGAETIYSAPATAAAADRDYLAIPGVDSLAA